MLFYTLTFPCILPPNVDLAWYTTTVTSPVTETLMGNVTFPYASEKPFFFSYSWEVDSTRSSPTYISTNGVQPFLQREIE